MKSSSEFRLRRSLVRLGLGLGGVVVGGAKVGPSLAASSLLKSDILERGVANVRDFGAKGDGLVDDSESIQAAIAGSSRVFFPHGSYLVQAKHGLNILRHGVELVGQSSSGSVLVQGEKCHRLLSIGSRVEQRSNLITAVSGIRITDLGFRGGSVDLGFAEHVHLLHVSAVDDLRIVRSKFSGFRGDGVYFAFSAGNASNLHNQNVVVEECDFDGLNRQNRNGISVIDGARIKIAGCSFQNCSRSDMPGSVDIEPNSSPRHVVENIEIVGCNFHGETGFVGHVGMTFIGPSYLKAPSGFLVSKNRFVGGNGIGVVDLRTEGGKSLDLLIDNNVMLKMNRALSFQGRVQGVRVENNRIEQTDNIRMAGFYKTPAELVGFKIVDNDFKDLRGKGEFDSRSLRASLLRNNSVAGFVRGAIELAGPAK